MRINGWLRMMVAVRGLGSAFALVILAVLFTLVWLGIKEGADVVWVYLKK